MEVEEIINYLISKGFSVELNCSNSGFYGTTINYNDEGTSYIENSQEGDSIKEVLDLLIERYPGNKRIFD